ncbi:DUF58 domain-containing protein [Dactylosporangium roseum]|uniref:DUF58 domain-containing protein n=1 Tax=Dactylosporangium roseum TaxID=47989 RepID=A0ABY5YXH0_9ACTN|nr:DUF58 domain-containing protein [Dactylosporangium roseum]UWZ34450.1 DUF58 domain-containing protein [Dactylosporangium roseum]
MPTPRGWTVLAAGVALLAVGLAAGYRELADLGSAGVLAVVLAACWVGLPPRLSVDRTIEPTRVGRGQRCRATLDIHTASGGTRVLRIVDPVAGPAGEQAAPVTTVRVRGGLPVRVSYDVPTDQRGELRVGPLLVGRRDLLGLCDARRAVGAPAGLLVRPRWHPLRGVPAGLSPSPDGNADGAQYGSIVFHALREYQFGDDLRRVHWRTSAHVGTLMVREHVDAALPRLVLLVDDSAEAYRGDAEAVETAVEAAASILVAAGRAGLPVVLWLASGRLPVETTEAGLDLLARLRPVPRVDLVSTARRLGLGRAGDTLAVVTGLGADLRTALAAQRGRGRALLVVLGGPAPSHPLPADIPTIVAGSAGEFVDAWNGMVR